MQNREELNNWYSTVDPWFYETTPDDQVRKDKIIGAIKDLNIESILDMGAGEGGTCRKPKISTNVSCHFCQTRVMCSCGLITRNYE